MNNKSPSSLALIMDVLHITAVDMAANIHVDPSLISRWKTGKRPFNNSSGHYENVLNYIIDMDEAINYQNIGFFMKSYFPDIEIKTRDDVYKLLDLWFSMNAKNQIGILSDNNSDTSTSAIVQIVKSRKEKCASLLNMLEMALTLPSETKLFLMFDTSTDSLFDEPGFYSAWIQKLIRIADSSHEIYCIYNNDSFYTCIVNLKNFMHLCQTGNFHTYYTNKSFTSFFDLLVLENTLAITNFVNSVHSEKYTLFLFSHHELIKIFEKEYFYYLSNCKPIFEKEENCNHIWQLLSSIQYIEPKVSIYSTTPFCFPISPRLLKIILNDNDFDEETKKEALDRYSRFFYNPFLKKTEKCAYLQLKTDEIRKALNNPYNIFLPDILLGSDKQIFIPRKHYALCMKELLAHIQSPEKSPLNISVSLILNTDFDLPSNTIVYTAENLYTYMCSFSSNETPKVFFSSNSLFSKDIYDYLENIYENLSEKEYNKHHISQIISHILYEFEKEQKKPML